MDLNSYLEKATLEIGQGIVGANSAKFSSEKRIEFESIRKICVYIFPDTKHSIWQVVGAEQMLDEFNWIWESFI